MSYTARRPAATTMAALILAFPYTVLVVCFLLRIDLGPIFGVDPHPDGARLLTSTVIALVTLAMNVAATVIGGVGTIRDLRSARGPFAHPARLITTAVALANVVLSAAGFVIDQYPCWIGVPNCD